MKSFPSQKKLFLTRILCSMGLVFVTQSVSAQSSLQVKQDAAKESSTLPEIVENIGERKYQVLGPVGIHAKELLQAREQLRKEASELEADALIGVFCNSGGVRREGLQWHYDRAYCKGTAIRWEK